MKLTDAKALQAVFAGCDLLGPGGPEETRALARALGLARGQRVLELGGGTGRAAIQVAGELSVEVVVVEVSPGLANQARKRALRESTSGRVTVREADMRDAADLFPPASFDAILAEGSLYFMGHEAAATLARRALKPGGRIGFTELAWVVGPARIAPRLRAFWDREAPGIVTPVKEKLASLERAGFVRPEVAFTQPAEAWDRYYGPVRENIEALRAKGAESTILDDIEEEIRLCYEMGGRDAMRYVAFVAGIA